MPHHPTFGYPETKKFIQDIQDPGLQTFARVGYLLGGRIMELLPLKSNGIEQKEEIIISTINTLKTRKGKYIFRDLPNSLEEERYYVQALIDFKEFTRPGTTLKDYLQIGGARMIEIRFKRELGMVPHSLRHLRATHMGHELIPSVIHKPTAAYLKYYFGWKNISTANEYIDNLTIGGILEEYQKQKVSQL